MLSAAGCFPYATRPPVPPLLLTLALWAPAMDQLLFCQPSSCTEDFSDSKLHRMGTLPISLFLGAQGMLWQRNNEHRDINGVTFRFLTP